MSTESTEFEYVSEPTQGALIVVVVIVVIALLIPLPSQSYESQWNFLIRLMIMSIAGGMFIWAGIQWLLHGRRVRLKPDYVLIQTPLTWGIRQIPYSLVRGCALTRHGGLVLAYDEPLKSITPGAQVALTDLRANLESRVKKHLIVTPPVKESQSLLQAVSERVTQTVPEDVLLVRVARRRLRRFILALLAFLATPIYVIILSRIFFSFMKGL